MPDRTADIVKQHPVPATRRSPFAPAPLMLPPAPCDAGATGPPAVRSVEDLIDGPRVVGGRRTSRSVEILLGDAQSATAPTTAEATPASVAARADLHVRERWSVRAGRTALFALDDGQVEIDYLVPAGRSKGYITAFDTGRPVDSVRVDRSMHLVEHALECEYCGTETCNRCDLPAEACVVCGVRRCGRCTRIAHPLPICGACGFLEPAGRRTTRRRVGRRGFLLVGSDEIHGVDVAIPAVGRPTVELKRADGTVTFPVSDTGEHYIRTMLDLFGC